MMHSSISGLDDYHRHWLPGFAAHFGSEAMRVLDVGCGVVNLAAVIRQTRPGEKYGVSSFFKCEVVISLFIGAVVHDIRIALVRPRTSLPKQLGGLLLGDRVIKGFPVTARVP